MNFPSKGSRVLVEGYGSAIFAGASMPEDEDMDDVVLLKFEGTRELEEGYGRGIIEVPVEEFKENRVYPEQVADGEPLIESTEKRDEILEERISNIQDQEQ